MVWVDCLDGASDRRRVRTLVRSIVLPRPFKGIYLFYVASFGPSDVQFIPFDHITDGVFDVVTRRCFGDLLDDAGKLAAEAASVDEACDVFVEVLVQPKKVDGQIQYTKVEAGRRACDVWKDAGPS